jgi:hypothetical protein
MERNMSTFRCPDCGAIYAASDDDKFSAGPACPKCGWYFSQQREWYFDQEHGIDPAPRAASFMDLWANYPANADIFEHSRYQPEGPIIRHLACERFGHASFTSETMQRLTDWLKYRYGPDADVFGIPLAEVVAALQTESEGSPPDVQAGTLDSATTATASAVMPASEAAQGGQREEPPVECYVTLDKMAAIVDRSKRTMEKYKAGNKNPLPRPDVEGGGGRPDEWNWPTIRPWLENVFGKKLPEVFPSHRFRDGRADRS